MTKNLSDILNKITLGFGIPGVCYYLGYQYYSSIKNSFGVGISVEEILSSQDIFMWGFQALSPLFISLFLIILSQGSLDYLHRKFIIHFGGLYRWRIMKERDGDKYFLFFGDKRLELEIMDTKEFEKIWKSKNTGKNENEKYFSKKEFQKSFKKSIKDIFKEKNYQYTRIHIPLNNSLAIFFIVPIFYLAFLSLLSTSSNLDLIIATYIFSFLVLITLASGISQLLMKKHTIAIFYGFFILFLSQGVTFFIEHKKNIFKENISSIEIKLKNCPSTKTYKSIFETKENSIVFDPAENKTKLIPKKEIEFINYR